MHKALLWAPLAALLALAGCDGRGNACGALVWNASNEPCDACMQNHCCAQLAACDIDTPCGRLTQCVMACAPNDTACTDACVSAQPDGVSAMQTLFACYHDSCQSTPSCVTHVCGTRVAISDAACGACLSAHCCDTWKPCAADKACVACLTQDPKPAGCATDSRYRAASACFIDTCGDACAATICDSDLGTEKAACNVCLGKPDGAGGCCEATKICKSDPDCYACFTGQSTAGCDANAHFQAWSACIAANCAAPCSSN
jgi:hypothetical protein